MSNLDRDLKAFLDVMTKAAQRADALWNTAEESRATLDQTVRQQIFNGLLAGALLPAAAVCRAAGAGKQNTGSPYYTDAELKNLARDVGTYFVDLLQNVNRACEAEERRPAPVPGRVRVEVTKTDKNGRITEFKKVSG